VTCQREFDHVKLSYNIMFMLSIDMSARVFLYVAFTSLKACMYGVPHVFTLMHEPHVYMYIIYASHIVGLSNVLRDLCSFNYIVYIIIYIKTLYCLCVIYGCFAN